MKICFVGHTFHERTGSSRFMRDCLGGLGELTVLTSSPDENRLADDDIIIHYLESDYDLWVFWQTEYVAARLVPLGLRNAVIAPMYDGARGRPDDFWRQFVNSRFLSFSRTLHGLLQRLDQRSASFEYWPEPVEDLPARDMAEAAWSAFFWERRPLSVPNARTVAQQCKALGIGRLHVHAAPDFPAEAERAHSYRMRPSLGGVSLTTSTWFDDNSAYLAKARAPQFYFAPRLYEGIGMATLEAMAAGQIVVAPDRPTANEYIGHRASGLLYDPERPLALPTISQGEAEDLSEAARMRVRRGHATFQMDRERLVSFVLDDGKRWPATDASAHFSLSIQRAIRSRRMKAFGK